MNSDQKHDYRMFVVAKQSLDFISKVLFISLIPSYKVLIKYKKDKEQPTTNRYSPLAFLLLFWCFLLRFFTHRANASKAKCQCYNESSFVSVTQPNYFIRLRVIVSVTNIRPLRLAFPRKLSSFHRNYGSFALLLRSIYISVWIVCVDILLEHSCSDCVIFFHLFFWYPISIIFLEMSEKTATHAIWFISFCA